ncbi:MAG: hypothetical protein V2A58_06725 [Planctomycetota bacterium]
MKARVLVAKKLVKPPKLDGEIPKQWAGATIFRDFELRGGTVTQKTRAYAGYDGRALYLAFVMEEERTGEIRTNSTGRTRRIGVRAWINEDDSIQVLIDPRRNGTDYVHFLVNPAGKYMTSRGTASPDRLECDYAWTPKAWQFRATVERKAWTVRMRIPAADLGLEGFTEGQQLGINFIRERTPDPHETSYLAPDTMSWTTQWTSHVVYEPAEFGVLALGKVTGKVQEMTTPQWPGPARARRREGLTLLAAPGADGAAQRRIPKLAGRELWCIHPPIEAFPGLEETRLGPFGRDFGWRLHREVTRELEMELPRGREWTWWLYGLDRKKIGDSPWTQGVTQERLGASVFTIEGRRYTTGQCLPPYRRLLPVAAKGFEQLVEKFGDRFIGSIFDEWDSDVWSVVTGMRENPEWDDYPDETPGTSGNREEEERTLRQQWDLFSKLSYGRVAPMNCWRCVDHYALEWGGRCALIEISENGNPSMLTQLAFARGAARQYGKFFATYQATILGTGYTSYTEGLTYEENIETAWATGPNFGPSKEFYRRLLFTSYLSGATVLMFEHPQEVHVMPPRGRKKHQLSPHGEVFAELLEYDARHKDRGVPYQPVALVLDYLHGFSPPYQTCYAIGRSGMQTWFTVPYERRDHQVFQTFWTIFPWCRQRIERHGYILTNTPFGDLFDVLTANPPSGVVPADVLGAYRAAVLVGAIRMSEKLKERLVDYVRTGGTLVVNALHYEELPHDLRGGEVAFSSSGVDVTVKECGKGRMVATPESHWLDDDNRALPVLGEVLATIAHELSPVDVRGDVQYHYLKTKRGWAVALLNNKGIVHHSRRKPEKRPEEAARVELVYDGKITSSVERLTGEEVAWQKRGGRQTTTLTVDAGGMRIVEIA